MLRATFCFPLFSSSEHNIIIILFHRNGWLPPPLPHPNFRNQFDAPLKSSFYCQISSFFYKVYRSSLDKIKNIDLLGLVSTTKKCKINPKKKKKKATTFK